MAACPWRSLCCLKRKKEGTILRPFKTGTGFVDPFKQQLNNTAQALFESSCMARNNWYYKCIYSNRWGKKMSKLNLQNCRTGCPITVFVFFSIISILSCSECIFEIEQIKLYAFHIQFDEEFMERSKHSCFLYHFKLCHTFWARSWKHVELLENTLNIHENTLSFPASQLANSNAIQVAQIPWIWFS